MKISKKDFENMKEKYGQEVKKGKPAKGEKKVSENQTDWIFFDRKTLEEILGNPKAEGIKFYFTEYTEDVAKEYYPANPDEYVGRLNLVMTASADNGKIDVSDEIEGQTYFNRAQVCPPYCQ